MQVQLYIRTYVCMDTKFGACVICCKLPTLGRVGNTNGNWRSLVLAVWIVLL